jgi:elongation factor Ts
MSIQAIKELRERTQAGMGDCKLALQEAGGDMEKAVEIILKKGQAKSAKRAGKVASEGEVRGLVYDHGRRAVMVEVNIETDFSARNDKFKALVDLALRAAQTADGKTELANLPIEGKELTAHAEAVTAIVGEKITLRRYAQVAVPEGKLGFCTSYIHMGGKIGVLLAIEAGSAGAAEHAAAREFAEETAMQIAAMAPVAIRRDEVDAATIAKQREIFEAQLREEAKPKPEKMWPKIIDGKIAKWFEEVALLEQESAQHSDTKKKISDLLAEAGKAAGASLEIVAFVRYELGEGIERQKDDLSAGVAELLR